MEQTLLKRLLDNAFSGLSLIALGGLLSGFLSYCASYGQFAQLDPALMPAFSSADLATNFAILAIPLFNAVVAAIFMAPFITDYIIKSRPVEGNARWVSKTNISLLIVGVLGCAAYVLGSSDIYLIRFKIGVLAIAVALAFMLRLRRDGKKLDLDWGGSPFASAHMLVLPILVIAWTLSSYGSHATMDRMKNFAKSGVYLEGNNGTARKVAIIFASQERAVLFDGERIFIISSEAYDRLISKPDLADFDNRSYLRRIFD